MAFLSSLMSFLPDFLSSNTLLLLLTSSLIVLIYFWINSGPTEDEIFAKRNVKVQAFGNTLWLMLTKVRIELLRDEILKKGGLVLGAIQMRTPTIYIGIPEVAQQVLSKNFTSFTNRRTIKFPDELFANMLFMLEDDRWKRCRSIMTPTFAMGKLRLMKPILDDTARTLVDNFNDALAKSNDGIVEIKNVAGAFTMDTIIQIAFGVKMDSLADPNNVLLKHAKSIFQADFDLKRLTITAITFFAPTIARIFDLRVNAAAIDYFALLSRDIINNKRKALKVINNNMPEYTKATNFIELLLEAENERLALEAELVEEVNKGNISIDKKPAKAVKYMTNTEIVAQCIMFLMVGYDTTATTITLTLYNLALHPESQERLYEEIVHTIKDLQAENPEETDPVRLLTMERIQKMKYLESCVKETLRLYPPAIFTERKASEDVTLENGDNPIHVKNGDIINIPIYTMHRDPAYWNEPETYNPERFMDPNPSFHRLSYLPFGAGPRDCIAKSLAYLEAMVAVLHAVRVFKLSRCDKTSVPVEFYYQVQMLINKDIHLAVERRV